MTRFILLLGGSGVVSIVVKATVIAVLGLFGAWLGRGSRAAVRHAVLAVCFAALLGLPVASLLIPPVRVAVAQAPSVSSGFADAIDTTLPSAPMKVSAPSASRWSVPRVGDLLFAGWIVGVVFFLLRIVIGLLQVSLLRRFGLPWREGQAVVERMAVEAGVHRHVELLLHESLPAPVTCGVFRPAILFPPDARNWDGEDLGRAILHELEHVRRWDWMSQCFARVVRAVYWFHPLVWIAWRQFALNAERACDDAVLRRSEATAYADQLVELAQRLSTGRKSPALAMANRSDLSSRVRAVLDGRQQRGRAGAVLVAVACAVATVVVLTMSPLRVVAAPQSGSGQTASLPAFEVASVKASPPDGGTMGIGLSTYPGGRIYAHNSTLHLLIMWAFDTELFQFPGAPAWVNDDRFRFDVEAIPPASSASSKANPPYPKAPPNNEQRQMLLNLLVERFGLKFHREAKAGPVYLLTRGTGQLRLRDPKDTNAFPWAGTANGGPVFASGMAGTNISMTQLAKRLEPVVGRPVLDKTGLNGSFDFKTEAAQNEFAPFDPNVDRVASILTSLRELGFKLESSTAEVETVVIDHAEKPSLN